MNNSKIISSFSELGSRIGLIGGSFDPVHNAHVELASLVQKFRTLDSVVFIPTAQNPLKPNAPRAAAEQRCAMLELAISREPNFYISLIELQRSGPSYSVETLRAIRRQVAPGTELFFVLGADCVSQIEYWKDYQELFKLATVVVVSRQGTELSQALIHSPELAPELKHALESQQLDLKVSEISSTQVRQLVRDKKSILGLVDPQVASYIALHSIYL